MPLKPLNWLPGYLLILPQDTECRAPFQMEHNATVFKALPTPTKQTKYTQPNAKRRKVQPQISRTNTDNEEDRARE